MIIGLTLMILIILSFLSIILGENFISSSVNVLVDNISILNGTTSTYEVPQETVVFIIDPIAGGIAIIIAIGIIAAVLGVTVLGSGLNQASVRIILLIGAYTEIWILLSGLSANLIKSIEVFGVIIYIGLTLGYIIGVVQKITGAE